MSRSRASSAARNSGACHSRSRPQRWCRGRKPKPWSRRRSRQSPDRSLAACASPISAPAPARCCSRCSSELPNAVRHRHRHQRRRARSRARQCAVALVPDRARILPLAILARRCAGRSISLCPTRPISRAAISRRWSRKCATTIRAWRSTAASTALTPIARWRRMPRRLLAPEGYLVVELGCRAGAACGGPDASGRTCGGCAEARSSRASSGACWAVRPMRGVAVPKVKNSTWIIRLRATSFFPRIDPRRSHRVRPGARLREASGATRRTKIAGKYGNAFGSDASSVRRASA